MPLSLSELERRLAGDPEPIGIMTHHLVHEEASWDFLDELFGLTARAPGGRDGQPYACSLQNSSSG